MGGAWGGGGGEGGGGGILTGGGGQVSVFFLTKSKFRQIQNRFFRMSR